MELLQMANLALRFLLELCALVSLGYWGAHASNRMIGKILLGVGAPLLLAIIWGLFGSPNASIMLSPPAHLLLEVIVFGLSALALYAAGKHFLAILFACLFVINRLLMFIWQQ